jgi:hypothetical protein
MPPHCDSLDGPVVRAARRALGEEDVTLVLPFVPKTGEKDVTELFHKVLHARKADPVSREVADEHFFDTVVRLHRAGEGAPFTGLKPAGLDVGPVIPVAEHAAESGESHALEEVLVSVVRSEVKRRLRHLAHLRPEAGHGVDHAREYVKASLGLQVWAHGLYTAARTEPHAAAHEH